MLNVTTWRKATKAIFNMSSLLLLQFGSLGARHQQPL